VNYILENGIPYYVSFDHDLADIKYEKGKMSWEYREKTGYDSAKWLCYHCLDNNIKFPEWQVHSANNTGKKNIESFIKNYIKHNE